MAFRAVVFDLDGTLLDTLADIAGAANEVLTEAGFPTHSTDAFRRFIGEGVGVLFRRALPAERADEATVARCVAGFQVAYGGCWNHLTRPYEGIAELLDALAERDVTLTLLSNKPHGFTQLCAMEYLGRWPFQVVLGAREGVPRKPDPTAALEIAALTGRSPGAFAYVGDSAIDMETARRAGMFAVGVTWGFRPIAELVEAGAEVIVDRPLDLIAVLGHEGPRAGR